MRNKKLIIEITAFLLVLLYLHTAISKFLDFEGFRYDLNNQPFPDSFTPFLVWALPLLEIAIVVCLFFEKLRILAFKTSLILMTMFTIYTALVLMHVFAYIPCSCGGVVKYLTWPQHLIFNLFFVAISFIGLRLSKQKEPYDLQKIHS